MTRHHPNRPRQPQKTTLVRKAVATLLQHPGMAAAAGQVADDWRRLQAPGIPLLSQLLDLALSQPNLTTAVLIERWRGSDYFDHLQKLANYNLTGGNSDPAQELTGALERLSQQARDQESENLYATKRLSDMSSEEKERLKQLMARRPRDDSGIEQ